MLFKLEHTYDRQKEWTYIVKVIVIKIRKESPRPARSEQYQYIEGHPSLVMDSLHEKLG